MSTGPKRNLKQATEDAKAFHNMFVGHFENWQTAGSVRRGKAEVGDIEHVVIPCEIHGVNDLWLTLDGMLPREGLFATSGIIEKAVYPDGSHRWGERYRGVMFRGFRHEVFVADALNWGAILAIRTGPAEFSQRLVTNIKQGGLRQEGGYVRDQHNNIVPVPDEETFLRLCGSAWIEPCDRV